jgi:hypothetical protein
MGHARSGADAGKKNPRCAGILMLSVWISGSSLDVRSLLAFWALRDVEIHFLTFFESLEATHVDCGKVCKQIFAAVIRSNKAKTFGIIEPLNGTSCHKSVFQILTITRAVKAEASCNAAPSYNLLTSINNA